MAKQTDVKLHDNESVNEEPISVWEQQIDQLVDRGDFQQAETLVSEAIAKFIDHRWLLLRAAAIASRLGKWETALKRWLRLQQIAPDLPDGVFGESICLLSMDDIEKSFRIFQDATNKFPTAEKHVNDHLSLLDKYIDSKIENKKLCYDLIVRAYDILLVQGRHAIVCARLASSRSYWDLAYRLWGELSNNFNDQAIVLCNFAEAAHALGQNKEAEELLIKALNLKLDEPVVVESIVKFKIDNGELDGAERILQLAAPMFKDHTWIQMLNAVAASRSKSWDTAVERWSLFRDKFPDVPAGWFEGAVAQQEMGNYFEANSLSEQGLKLHQCSTWDYITAINIAAKSEQLVLAVSRWISKLPSIGRTPHERQAYYNIGGDLLVKSLYMGLSNGVIENLWLELLAQRDERVVNFVPAILRQTLPLYFHSPTSFKIFKQFVKEMMSRKYIDIYRENLDRVVFALQLEMNQEKRSLIAEQMVLNSSLQMLSCLFDGWLMPDNVDLLKKLIPRIAKRKDLSHIALYNIAAFAATCNNDILGEIWNSASNLAEISDQDGPIAVLASAGDRRKHALSDTKKYRSLPRKLRVALCISGQLRGFERARKSWNVLGIDDCELDTFVHVWSNVGRKVPYPPHCERAFSGAFLVNFQDAFRKYGQNYMDEKYQSIFEWFRFSSIATPEQLRNFYKTDHIVVDDDSLEPFASMPNHVKMYYKAEKAWNLALSYRNDYDLVIRARPDKLLLEGKKVDLMEIYENVLRDRKILADGASFFHYDVRLGMGDQFAIGTMEAMDIYSRAYSITEQKLQFPSFGFPQKLLSHETFAMVAFYNGISVESWSHVNFGPPIDPDHISNGDLAALIAKDIRRRGEIELDSILLESLVNS